MKALLGAIFAAILYASSGRAEPANYTTSDCHQGDCAEYYLVKTFPSPPTIYPPFSTDEWLAHVKAIGYCSLSNASDCANGLWVAGDQGTAIYSIRCSEPGYIRGAGATSSLEEPYPRIRSHAT